MLLVMNADEDTNRPNSSEIMGVETSPIGTFVPLGSYRPIPIIWFAAAFLLQAVGLTVLFLMFANKPPIISVLIGLFFTIIIGYWTESRGMKHASGVWRIFTIFILALNFGLYSIGFMA